MTPTGQARTRALMLGCGLGLVAFFAPVPFVDGAEFSVFLLLLPLLESWVALEGGLRLRRAGLPLAVAVPAPPVVVGLAVGLAVGLLLGRAVPTLALWGAWTGAAAGLGSWLVLRRPDASGG